ncbi:MAG: AMP-binding protein [Planctomycetales bacterium]|nr:AMP-binding protein [Planctomycetales bacterium]
MQLEQFLEHSAAAHPDKIAIICGDRRLTYAEIESQCNRLAHGLIAEGVQRGDRVGVYLENTVEAVLSVGAILKAGAVVMMVHPTPTSNKLSFVLNNSRAAALILPRRKVRTLVDVWNETPHLKSVVTVGVEPEPAVDSPNGKSFVALDDLLIRHANDSRPPRKRCIDIDLAALNYTSGSTGNPKGVLLTHLNMVSVATSITTYLENRFDDIVLNVLPLSFGYGLHQVLLAFKVGGTVVLERGFTYPHAVLETVVRERVTGLPLVPTMLALLLQMDLSLYDFSHLRYVTNAAAALPVEHIRQLRQTLPHVTIFSMYGLTECTRVTYLPPDQIDIRPASVGRGMLNEEVYVVDDQGCRLGADEVGELVVRGANVMNGYWELPDETAKRLKPGPLPNELQLHTGDLFRTDDEGYLYFVGRKDDIIKCRGEKIAPREVENVLCNHPAVAEAAVIGIPDAILGQSIKAVVTLRPNTEVSERDLLRHCAANLEDLMVPQVVEIRESLPKTGNGKINKRELAGVTES